MIPIKAMIARSVTKWCAKAYTNLSLCSSEVSDMRVGGVVKPTPLWGLLQRTSTCLCQIKAIAVGVSNCTLEWSAETSPLKRLWICCWSNGDDVSYHTASQVQRIFTRFWSLWRMPPRQAACTTASWLMVPVKCRKWIKLDASLWLDILHADLDYRDVERCTSTSSCLYNCKLTYCPCEVLKIDKARCFIATWHFTCRFGSWECRKQLIALQVFTWLETASYEHYIVISVSPV